MHTDRLLLISRQPDDAAFARAAAELASIPITVVASPEEGVADIETYSPRFILVDASNPQLYNDFEKVLAERVGLFSDKLDSNAIHFLSSEDIECVPYLIGSPVFGSFILRNYQNPSDAGVHYGRILAAMKGERAFGLEKYLRTGTRIQTIHLQSSSQKMAAVETIRSYLLAAKFKTRMATIVANAVDEIVMNSMFDAPVDVTGNQVYASMPRSTVLPLEGRAAVELKVGFDGNYVAVTAIDHFGSISKPRLLSHISKVYTEKAYQVKASVAGAGIGLASIFQSGGSFLFVTDPNKRTEVTVFFRRSESFKDFRDQFRFIATQFYSDG